MSILSTNLPQNSQTLNGRREEKKAANTHTYTLCQTRTSDAQEGALWINGCQTKFRCFIRRLIIHFIQLICFFIVIFFSFSLSLTPFSFIFWSHTHTHLLSSLINSVYAIQHRWMSSQETAIIHIYQYIHRKYFTIYADNISTVGIVAVGTTSVENICFPRASNDSRIN